MRVSSKFARDFFERLESAVDRGESVEIIRQDGSILNLIPKSLGAEEIVTRESREAMFDSWKGKASLIEGWDSPETNMEIWEEFWAKLEEEGPFPNSKLPSQ